jgi:elongation factor G
MDQDTGQTLIAGMGELHLEILADRLKREFGVEGRISRPRVSYRETITQRAEGEALFDRETGGRSHFAQVKLEIEPLPSGEGFGFENNLSEEALVGGFADAVQQGCREAMESGVLVGYKLVDVKVRLVDAKVVEDASSELAFKVAGTKAFNQAVEQAKPVLL